MSRTIMIAALTALVATPAAAANSAGTQTTPANQNRTATTKVAATKYCLTYERLTGSRVDKTECKTKKSWAAEGVDIDRPDK